MFTGQFDVISNKATWISKDSYEVTDEATDDAIVLSDPSLSVAIQISIKDQDGCLVKTGSLIDGKVYFVDTSAFMFRFEKSDLCSLCAGTYNFGIKITVSNDELDLVLGTVAVLEGN